MQQLAALQYLGSTKPNKKLVTKPFSQIATVLISGVIRL